MLSREQLKAIASIRDENGPVSLMEIDDLFSQIKSIRDFTDSQYSELAKIANATYRAGCGIVADDIYDTIILTRLAEIDPENPIFEAVESEELEITGDKILHSEPMLSTNKAYTLKKVQNDLLRVVYAACDDLGISSDDITLRLTAKLDGLAGRDKDNYLLSRGDGVKGADLSKSFERGLKVLNLKTGDESRGQGVGEIVVLKSYFDSELSEHFEHPRNFMVGLVSADNPNEHAIRALKNNAAVFMPFVGLPSWEGSIKEFLANYDQILEQVRTSVDCYIDGVVLEVVNEDIKNILGSTSHHHKWQIAIKEASETGTTTVKSVVAQTGRTGKVSPVAELVPIYLSKATISRVTLHHYGMVRDLGIGVGAEVELIRSGEVIPKIISIIQRVTPEIPTQCPSCGSTLEWKKDALFCRNVSGCSAQLNARLSHWFTIMGNVDGFGPATIEKLTKNGISKISEIFALDQMTLIKFGFGQGESKKLLKEIDRCKKEEVEDWRFLAAFGVNYLGRGSCDKLLQSVKLMDVFSIDTTKLVSIDGFGQGTVSRIITGLGAIKDEVLRLHDLGFNLKETVAFDPTTSTSPIIGKSVVFTGSMQSGSRDDMKKHAKSLGAKVQSSVSSKTNFLICGEKVGAAKIEKAKKLNVTVVTESEYLEMIA